MIDDSLLRAINGKWCLDGVPYSGETKSSTGALRWYKDGNFHREDGPAIVCDDGSKFWYIHGLLHREDGPAYEGVDGSKIWHIRGKKITTWKEYHKLSTLSPQEQMVVKLRYGEQLK